MNAKVYYPHSEVHIYTETTDLILRGVASPGSNATNDVLSVVTRRDMGVDSPTFSINLVYRHDWFQAIASNDLVVISMCRPPEKLNEVMYGLVDDVRRNIVFSGDKPRRIITITGRGMCKAFMNFDLGIVNECDVTTQALGNIGREVTLEGCSASDGINSTIDSFLKNYINYKFSNGKDLFSIIQTNLSCNPEYTLQDASSLLNYQGSSWNFLKELQNAPFNEMFWEMDTKNNPTLILRETPFNESNWKSLPSTQLLDEEYIDESIGRSDMETYTLYSVQCMTFISEDNPNNAFGYVPLWYPAYVKKYGMRRLDAMSLYTMYAGTEDTATAETRTMDCTKDLFNWNIKNNSMYNGNIIVRGSNRFKIGTRLYVKADDMEYYIEGVTHTFNVYDSYKTQLSITRGVKPSERFTKPWGCSENYNPEELPHSATGTESSSTKVPDNKLISGGPNTTHNPELPEPNINTNLLG